MKHTLPNVALSLLVGACLPLGAGCGTPKGPTPGEVVAIGIATGIRDHGLARTTAQNRALSNLAQLMTSDAVNVELTVAGSYSTLTLERPAGKVAMRQVDFIPLTNGWMARARARRSDAMMKQLQTLPTSSGTATVGGVDLARALMIADARALRQAITAALPAPVADGVHRGKLTLVDRTVDFGDDDAVTVAVKVHLEHESIDELAESNRLAVIDAVTGECVALKEWQAAIDAKLARIDAAGDDAKARTFIGDAYLSLDDPAHAIEAFAAAAALEPSDSTHLVHQRDAAKRADNEALVKELTEKIDALAAASKQAEAEAAEVAAAEARASAAAAAKKASKPAPSAKKKGRKRR